jgi:phytoene/squalene synthetase
MDPHSTDDVNACAELLARNDPNRLRAVMACPRDLRSPLFALFAMNCEIAQAPWASQEPIICEMRLQWWFDALDDIASGKTVTTHPALSILCTLLNPAHARNFQNLVSARRWDIYRDPFDTLHAHHLYIRQTSGILYETAAALLHSNCTTQAYYMGTAIGAANFLNALPALERAGKIPMIDGRPTAIRDFATWGHTRIPKRLDRAARLACLSGYTAKTTLKQVQSNPSVLGDIRPSENPMIDRMRFLKFALIGP